MYSVKMENELYDKFSRPIEKYKHYVALKNRDARATAKSRGNESDKARRNTRATTGSLQNIPAAKTPHKVYVKKKNYNLK